MQRFKIIIVYLFTSSDKTIHRDLELLTSTSYTAVGSGFGPQGVPAEKPRNLLTHQPSQRVWVCWDCCCSVRIYISGTSNGALDLCIYAPINGMPHLPTPGMYWGL